ncbi:MAG: MoxR family ATPase [Desulfobacteraceae bacterium]|nr:MoxR family ATPase [Desulfobacteraceae bacterium]
MNADINTLKQIVIRTKEQVSKVIIGQDHVIDMALIAIFTGNHALVEGVPGVAKTLLVRTMAQILGCAFSRIQFTPDLMPADIIGTNVFNLKDNSFSLVKGPVFTTFLLADEINRAPAKTQSALLQAMQEKNVTIDRETFDLSENFTVFATQNPIEYEGTYPLPEAQKDRFLLKISMAPPNLDQELDLAKRTLGSDSPEKTLTSGTVKQILNPQTLVQFRNNLEKILIKDDLIRYCVDIVRSTRTHEAALTGAGPRGTQALIVASRAFAVINDRDFVTPDDIKQMAVPTLEHRLILRPEYEIEGLSEKEVIRQILTKVAVPR